MEKFDRECLKIEATNIKEKWLKPLGLSRGYRVFHRMNPVENDRYIFGDELN